MCSTTCCKRINQCFMILSALFAIVGAILIWVGGISVFRGSYWDAVNDGTVNTLAGNGFLSCQGAYDALWNNNTDTNKGAYITNTNVRISVLAQCVATQAPIVGLSAFTGLFVLGAGLAGVWGACKSTRGAIFSSGITVGYTVALLVLCVAMGTMMFSPLLSRFANCSGFSADDLKEAGKNNVLCVEGNVAGATPKMLQQADKVNSLIYVATRVACFFAGVVLSFLAVFMIKFTSTSAYHYEEELKEELKQGQGAAASGYTAPQTTMYAPMSR